MQRSRLRSLLDRSVHAEVLAKLERCQPQAFWIEEETEVGRKCKLVKCCLCRPFPMGAPLVTLRRGYGNPADDRHFAFFTNDPGSKTQFEAAIGPCQTEFGLDAVG